ncbi:hypothetical protein BVG16_31220 [Paenibacillus selenitireducens]|uniref:Uncharacterized protein n=1 Tax=Paenibacillus selenitireducens TaxID=1324314 RepID=A0A1T2WZ78_9BACL|nr:hypothetical protein [Paenibacillus selenitireducens]OPA72930.1 hypothetical protein BVG16_31220 [Paenibacillus selenitireducens]
MEKQMYARYLLSLMDEEADSDDVVIEEDTLYGYFQMYMPIGKGVEATFEPLEDGEAYMQRIVRIYEMLDPDDFSGDTVPGYFNSKADEVPEDVLKGYGEQLIKGLKQLLDEFAEWDGAAEAAAYLTGIEEVQLLPHDKIDTIRESYDPDVYEALFEVVHEHKNYDEPIEILDEAYYSIACDYWISYYLQWHRYGLKGDPLAPYFELYRLGYSAIFSERKLYIGS